MGAIEQREQILGGLLHLPEASAALDVGDAEHVGGDLLDASLERGLVQVRPTGERDDLVRVERLDDERRVRRQEELRPFLTMSSQRG